MRFRKKPTGVISKVAAINRPGSRQRNFYWRSCMMLKEVARWLCVSVAGKKIRPFGKKPCLACYSSCKHKEASADETTLREK